MYGICVAKYEIELLFYAHPIFYCNSNGLGWKYPDSLQHSLQHTSKKPKYLGPNEAGSNDSAVTKRMGLSKPSLKIGSVNKAFLVWCWQRLRKYFLGILFFKIESWNFQYLFKKELRETSRKGNFFSLRLWSVNLWIQFMVSSILPKYERKQFYPRYQST